MGKKGSTQVTPVDPWEAGRADATFNRIDSYTPFGNLTYSGPNRNQANLQLNPYLAGNEERRMLSDRMLLDTALGRQQQMNQGGLPSLTSGINPGAMQEFFGLPSSLQSGFDTAPTPPRPPNVIPGSDTPSGAKGGQQQLPGPPPGGPPQPGQKGGMSPNTSGTFQGGGASGFRPGQKGGMAERAQAAQTQPLPSNLGGTGPAVNSKGGGMQMPQQPYRPGADMSVKPQGQPTSAMGGGQMGGGQPQQQQSQSNPLFGGTVGGLIDPETFGQIGSLDQLQDFDLDRGRVEQNFYDRATSLLDRRFDQDQQRQEASLRARGIPRDSEAWDREVDNFALNKGETYANLARDAVLTGGGEQSRLFGMSNVLGDRSMNAQQSMFNMADMLAQRDIQAQLQNANISSMNRATQFNELASLLGLQQVASPGLNNFFAPGNVDMMGAYGMNQQARMANAQNNANMKGGFMQGVGDLAGAAIGAPAGRPWFLGG